jgi:trk system potassium uptake protein TrkA
MEFIIVGYGRVGIRTARILDEEGHEVIVVDNDPNKVDRATRAGYTVIEGDGAEESVLEDAGVTDAEGVGGLTGDLNTNFAACMIGKHYDCRTVLRIDDDYREDIYQKYADDVDEVVYPEQLGAAGAKTALLGGDFNVIADLTDELALSVITLPENAAVIGAHVNEIDMEDRARIYAHGRERKPMTIPLPGTTIEPGDRVALVAKRDTLDGVRSELIGNA